MSKRSNEGDILANRLSLIEAKGQKLIASLFGSSSELRSCDKAGYEDEDLKQDFSHDRLGLGAVALKDTENESSARRAHTSNDKLLEQLIGKKKARAHLAAQRESTRPNTKARTVVVKRPVDKDESDDEEGRGAIFQSKRRKTDDGQLKEAGIEQDDDANEEPREESEQDAHSASAKAIKANGGHAKASESAQKEGKRKSKSYLDEILAERLKKKKKKKKKKREEKSS